MSTMDEIIDPLGTEEEELVPLLTLQEIQVKYTAVNTVIQKHVKRFKVAPVGPIGTFIRVPSSYREDLFRCVGQEFFLKYVFCAFSDMNVLKSACKAEEVFHNVECSHLDLGAVTQPCTSGNFEEDCVIDSELVREYCRQTLRWHRVPARRFLSSSPTNQHSFSYAPPRPPPQVVKSRPLFPRPATILVPSATQPAISQSGSFASQPNRIPVPIQAGTSPATIANGIDPVPVENGNQPVASVSGNSPVTFEPDVPVTAGVKAEPVDLDEKNNSGLNESFRMKWIEDLPDVIQTGETSEGLPYMQLDRDVRKGSVFLEMIKFSMSLTSQIDCISKTMPSYPPMVDREGYFLFMVKSDTVRYEESLFSDGLVPWSQTDPPIHPKKDIFPVVQLEDGSWSMTKDKQLANPDVHLVVLRGFLPRCQRLHKRVAFLSEKRKNKAEKTIPRLVSPVMVMYAFRKPGDIPSSTPHGNSLRAFEREKPSLVMQISSMFGSKFSRDVLSEVQEGENTPTVKEEPVDSVDWSPATDSSRGVKRRAPATLEEVLGLDVIRDDRDNEEEEEKEKEEKEEDRNVDATQSAVELLQT